MSQTSKIAALQFDADFLKTQIDRLRTERDAARSELREKLTAHKKTVDRFVTESLEFQDKILKLEDRMTKQARTIQVQSDTIQAPREVNHTPHRGTSYNQPSASVNVFTQPPPIYSGRQMNPPSQPPPTPRSTRWNKNLPPANVTNTMTIQDTELPAIQWIPEFKELFGITEAFARNFCNVPNKERDLQLHPHTVHFFRTATDDSSWQNLLTSGDTRYLLIARAMNQWITWDVLRPALLRGQFKEIDDKLDQTRDQMLPGIPTHVRSALMLITSDLYNEVKNAPTYPAWLNNTISIKTSALWDKFGGLFAPGVVEKHAWDDLTHLVAEAIRIGVNMICQPLSWSLDYPQTHQKSFFNPHAMINKDRNFPENPVALSRQRVRVRLAITPVIVATSFEGSSIIPKTLHYANVLLQR